MSSVIGQIGARVASEQDRLLAAEPLPSSEDVLAGIGRRRVRAQRRVRIVAAAAASLVVLLVVSFGARTWREPQAAPAIAIATAVAPRQPALGVTRAEEASVPLQFDDGTKIVVARGATAELREVRAHGAVIALEGGTVNVDVVHTPESRWDVNAGPFDIRVTGTKFDATWDASAKRLTVAMTEGTVVVSGPCVNEPLAAPHRKVFTCPAEPAPAEVASVDVNALAPAPSPVEKQAAASAPPPPRETVSALMAEADAARLGGDAAKAKRLYASVRERFPGTDQAGKSAFLLGRMADASGSPDEALRWFEAAARERGGFAQEALGRSMELEQKRGRGDRAYALALDYLKKHPRGPYAAYATSIVDAHR
ncbi:MAG: FecR domain-containing protein [Labilithrix sp.]|nr:FecR domain-containing protein [Labilithrix sp.]